MVDICDIAIQIERNGESAYREAAGSTQLPEVAKLLEVLAEDEAKHARWFEQISADQPLRGQDQSLVEMGRDLLRDTMEPHSFSLDDSDLGSAEHPKDVLKLSIEFEKDTILFYEMLSGFLEDDETKYQLERVVEEERSHIDKLKQILAFQNEIRVQTV